MKSDYIVVYWIAGEYEDRQYEYVPFVTYDDACLYADRKVQDMIYAKYADDIQREAIELMADRTRMGYHGSLADTIDEIVCVDYIQYSVYRVLPETPAQQLDEWVDDPELFIEHWTIQEA